MTSVVPNWWICQAFLEAAGTHQFVYGCAAACDRLTRTAWDRTLSVGEGVDLRIVEAVLDASEFEALYASFSNGEGKMVWPTPSTPSGNSVLPVFASRSSIQQAFGSSAAPSETFYTLEDLSILDTPGLQRRALFEALQVDLGLPFLTTHAKRIGTFEVFQLPSWREHEPPFVLENIADPKAHDATIRLRRTPEYATNHHVAHVICKVRGRVVINRFASLDPGKERVIVAEWPETLSTVEFSMFEAASGALVHTEVATFLNSVGMAMTSVHGRTEFQDGLTRRENNGDPKALTSVSRTTTLRSIVDKEAGDLVRAFEAKVAIATASVLNAPLHDVFFGRGTEGEVEVIRHLNSLISGARVSRAVLVDPYFGSAALLRFARRLTSQDVHLTVLASWHGVDPDSEDGLRKVDFVAELERHLTALKGDINPKLNVVNLVASGNKQAFHDRYLVLYRHEGVPDVYLLSNSINNMAGKWPFCMSRLEDRVAEDVRLYIEGLLKGQDITGSTCPEVSFTWP